MNRIKSTTESPLCARPYILNNSVPSAAWGPTTSAVSQDVAKSLAIRFWSHVRGASYFFRQEMGAKILRRSSIRVLHVVKAVGHKTLVADFSCLPRHEFSR
jgi:hypothetical protein